MANQFSKDQEKEEHWCPEEEELNRLSYSLISDCLIVNFGVCLASSLRLLPKYVLFVQFEPFRIVYDRFASTSSSQKSEKSVRKIRDTSAIGNPICGGKCLLPSSDCRKLMYFGSGNGPGVPESPPGAVLGA